MEQKFIPPTNHALAPFRTIWHVKKENDQWEYWIQISRNDTGKDATAHWIRVGDLFEKAFEKNINDEAFINECFTKIS